MSRPQIPSASALEHLVGRRLPGACDHCAGWQILTRCPDDLHGLAQFVLSIHHTPTCPTTHRGGQPMTDINWNWITGPELDAMVFCAGDEECREHITPDPRHRDNLEGRWRCPQHARAEASR